MAKENSSSLINLGDLAKPADTLIKKLSKALGVLYEPTNVRRIAAAKADAALTEAKSQIQITDLQNRAVLRWIEEEARHQKNMEEIANRSLKQLNSNADPSSVEDDWIVNFFDKCRIISDTDMQRLWSRVLAGEANSPGTYSRRTVKILADLDKHDAVLFTNLCRFCWMIEAPIPLVFDEELELYNRFGINFGSLNHLDSIGLIEFGSVAGFVQKEVPREAVASYYGRHLRLQLPKDSGNEISVGNVLLTNCGKELAPICKSRPVEGFWEYVKSEWKQLLPETNLG